MDDFLLFIDANKYLDLYRINRGKELLAPLAEQVEYIFVTQQVVNEFQRNKILVAAEFLKKQAKELKLQTFDLPEHLSNEQRKEILQHMREIHQNIKKTNAEVDALVLSIMEQISHSEDEVSKAFSPIFASAVSHSPEELQRAKERRELGNPPGKITNPIGDQLTWEQILTHFKGKRRLWIISRDGDYGTVFGGKGFLNRFLYDELCSIASKPEVYLFQNIVEGINHFIDTTEVKAEKRLTPEEAEEIEREEKSLPYLTQPSESLLKAMENFRQLSQPSESLLKAMENFRQLSQPSESQLKAIANNMGQISQATESQLKAIANNMGQISQATESQLKAIKNNMGQISQATESQLKGIANNMGQFNQTSENQLKMLSGLQKSSIQVHQSLDSAQEKQEEKDEKPETFPHSFKQSENNDGEGKIE